ncbi:MAG: class I SAM-dependent methyltransferase [Moraxella sp.]|mgnify:FL=1
MTIWDERYQDSEYVFGVEPNKFLAQIAHLLPNSGRALDLATGEGRNAVFLAKHGLTTTGVDVSQVGLEKAKRLAKDNQVIVDFINRDICTMDWQAPYEVISSVFFHLPVPKRFEIAKKIIDALSPNGLFVGVFYHTEQLKFGTGGPSKIEMLGTLEDWQAAYNGLKWLYAKHHILHLNEGNRHIGKSSVVCLLGQKVIS